MIIITLLVRTASLSCLNTPCLTSYGSGHSICISILHLGTAQPYPMVQLPGENRSTMLGQGFPGVSLSKESICNTGDAGDLGSVLRLGRWAWQPAPVFLPGESRRQRNLTGYSPWGHREADTTQRLHFHFSLSCIREGNGNPLQCSCLENPRDRGAW